MTQNLQPVLRRLLAAVLIAGAASLPAQSTIPGVTRLSGAACTGGISAVPWPLAVTGSASIGGSLQLRTTMGAFTSGVIVGGARLDLPLQQLFGCPCTLVPSLTLFDIGGPNFSLTLPIPNQPALIGTQLWAQPYYYDGLQYFPCSTGGTYGYFSIGDAVEITIQP